MEYDTYVDRVEKILSNVMGAPVKREIIQDYISRWQTAKQPWLDLFKGNTIYTYPTKVECNLSEEERLDQVERYIKKLKSHNYRYSYGRSIFADFLRTQGLAATENLVAYDYQLTPEITIPKGMKLLRAFKYFFTEKEDITQAQDEMNLIISRTKFTGYLHFSVDPLDYLSISENTYGWRSCHSLDGDYAVGNLEYMMDTTTVVCYIDDGTQAKLPNFPEDILWNNKRWRVLLFFAPDHRFILASRQYPFTMNDIFPTLRKCISDFFPSTIYEPRWTNKYLDGILPLDETHVLTLHEKHVIAKIAGRIYPFYLFYKGGNHFFYDDILNSSYYTKPYYLVGYRHYGSMRTNFEPIVPGIDSATLVCPVCGNHCFYVGEGMECEDLDNGRFTCENCGRRHMHENEGTWVGDQWWCQTCIDNYASVCSKCGEVYALNDLTLNEDTGEYICYNCMEENE